ARHERRGRHAPLRRPAEVHARHLRHLRPRLPRHHRLPGPVRLLLQGQDHRVGLRQGRHRGLDPRRLRPAGRGHHRVLHDARDADDVLRRGALAQRADAVPGRPGRGARGRDERRGCFRTCRCRGGPAAPARVAEGHDDPDDRAGRRIGRRRCLLQHRRPLPELAGAGHRVRPRPLPGQRPDGHAGHGRRDGRRCGRRLGPVRAPPGPGGRPARFAPHPGRPPRPPPGRLQPRGPGPRRRTPHALAGVRRPHPGRRRRQRNGGLVRRPVRPHAPTAERLRALLRGLHVRRRGGPGRRDPADEGGLIPMSFPLLTATAALPAIGAIATAAVPASKRTAAKWLALLVSLATCVLAVAILVRFEPGGDRYQHTESDTWIADFGVRYDLAGTALLIPFIVLASWHDADPLETGSRRWRPTQGFFALILAIEAMVILAFTATDVFLFYILFEAMLIPLYFLIGGFGDRAHEHGEKAGATQRSYAAVKFLLYNLAGGLIMLAAVIGLYMVAGNFSLTEIAE